jgi:hypothetical protein
MQTIPVTVLDNFFDDPDGVRKWALEQKYFSDPAGSWPGKRTLSLDQLNLPFLDHLSRKYFSLFFNFDKEDVRWKIDAYFQLIDKHSGSGWVHHDCPQRMSGIIYLSPNASLDGGTSIFKRKNGSVITNFERVNKAKIATYLQQVPPHETEHIRLEDRAVYEETIKVGNVYNRLLTFDGHLHHAAQDFFGENLESRLTLIFFITQLFADKTPVMRTRITD